MRQRMFVLIAAVLVFVPVLAFGQLKEQLKPQSFSQLLTQPQGLAGLLGIDPTRFSMQHSFSISYLSAGGQGFSQGLYLNTLSYRFSDPLRVSLQWGVMNQPFGSFGVPSLYENGLFLSGASVEYKPSRNLSIGLQYNKIPGGWQYSPYRSYLYDQNLQPLTPSENKEDR